MGFGGSEGCTTSFQHQGGANFTVHAPCFTYEQGKVFGKSLIKEYPFACWGTRPPAQDYIRFNSGSLCKLPVLIRDFYTDRARLMKYSAPDSQHYLALRGNSKHKIVLNEPWKWYAQKVQGTCSQENTKPGLTHPSCGFGGLKCVENIRKEHPLPAEELCCSVLEHPGKQPASQNAELPWE